MALFDFETKRDELDSLLEGYEDGFLEEVLEASSKTEAKGKLAQLKQSVSDTYHKAMAPANIKNPDWDIKETQKQMMDAVESGNEAYIKRVIAATTPGTKQAKTEEDLNHIYMRLYPYNGKKIKAQMAFLNGPFRKAAMKKAKELNIAVESYMGILEEAAVAVFESDDDIKDAFLLDKDAVVIGAEDDEDVEKFIDKIPEDAEDEDLDDLVEAFVESDEDDEDDDEYEEDDDDIEDCEESLIIDYFA